MHLTKVIPLDPNPVTVRELTVAEIRVWFADLTQPHADQDVVDLLLFRDVSLRELLLMSDITLDAVASLTPSAINKVIAGMKEVNSHFFDLRERLAEIGARNGRSTASPPSSAVSAP